MRNMFFNKKHQASQEAAVQQQSSSVHRRKKWMITAALVAVGLGSIALFGVFIKDAILNYESSATNQNTSDLVGRNFGEKGGRPGRYGFLAPFPNGTVTVTESDAVTTTVDPCLSSANLSVTLTPTATATVTAGQHAPSVMGNNSYTIVTVSTDVLPVSVISTDVSSSLETPASETSTLPDSELTVSGGYGDATQELTSTLTATSSLVAPTTTADSEMSTEIVTVTPLVTTTQFTTMTISSSMETPVPDGAMTDMCTMAGTETVTVYVYQSSTETQTATIGTSVSIVSVMTPEPVTITVTETETATGPISAITSTPEASTSELVTVTIMHTVIPEPANVTTTESTSPVMTPGSTPVHSLASSVTVITTTVVTTMAIGPSYTTVYTYGTLYTLTLPMEPISLPATHTPFPVSESMVWSTYSGPVTSESTATPIIGTNTSVPVIQSSFSSDVVQPTDVRPPFSSEGNSLNAWDWGADGSASVTCVAMLVAVAIAIAQNVAF